MPVMVNVWLGPASVFSTTRWREEISCSLRHSPSPAPLMSTMFCVIITRRPSVSDSGRSLVTKSCLCVVWYWGGSCGSDGVGCEQQAVGRARKERQPTAKLGAREEPAAPVRARVRDPCRAKSRRPLLIAGETPERGARGRRFESDPMTSPWWGKITRSWGRIHPKLAKIRHHPYDDDEQANFFRKNLLPYSLRERNP